MKCESRRPIRTIRYGDRGADVDVERQRLDLDQGQPVEGQRWAGSRRVVGLEAGVDRRADDLVRPTRTDQAHAGGVWQPLDMQTETQPECSR